MAEIKEKLVDLIRTADRGDYESETQNEHYAYMADKLIEGGATVQKHGCWVGHYSSIGNCFYYHCSECGESEPRQGTTRKKAPYCPECGAIMDQPRITDQTAAALKSMGAKAHGGAGNEQA